MCGFEVVGMDMGGKYATHLWKLISTANKNVIERNPCIDNKRIAIAVAYNEAVAAASTTQYLDMCAHNIEKRGGATHPKRHNIAIKN